MVQWNYKQKGCTVASSGRCVDGIDPPAGCPHILQSDNRQSCNEHQGSRSDAAIAGRRVLDFDQTTSILRAEPGKILLVAGAQRSGKTTPLAIYELFNGGHLLVFASLAAETLFAFESMSCGAGSL